MTHNSPFSDVGRLGKFAKTKKEWQIASSRWKRRVNTFTSEHSHFATIRNLAQLRRWAIPSVDLF